MLIYFLYMKVSQQCGSGYPKILVANFYLNKKQDPGVGGEPCVSEQIAYVSGR